MFWLWCKTEVCPGTNVHHPGGGQFDPVDFPGVFGAAAYLEPDLLRRDRLPAGAPGAEIVPVTSSLQQGQRACPQEWRATR